MPPQVNPGIPNQGVPGNQALCIYPILALRLKLIAPFS